MPTLDADPTYYALDPDDAAGTQPSAMQMFLSQIAPGVSPPLTGSAVPLPTPYGNQSYGNQSYGNGTGGVLTQSNVPLPPPPGSVFDQTQAAIPPMPQTALQSFQAMQNLPPNIGRMTNITQAQPGGAGPQVPSPVMPRHKENNIVKFLGALGALAGGSGGQVAGAYLGAQRQNDEQNYARQVENYGLQNQQQQQQQKTQQDTTQQTFDNTQTQERSLSALMDTLQGMDDDSQQQFVAGLAQSPTEMQAYGLTPQQVTAQFYGADGAFQPVGIGGSKGAQAQAANLRSQTANRKLLYGMSPAAQIAYHDSFSSHPQDFENENGVPYENFTPGNFQTALDVEAKQGDTQADALAKEQATNRAALFGYTPAVQAAIHGAMMPEQWTQYSGLPYDSFKPGMTEKNAQGLLSINNRETDATRSDSTKNTLGAESNATRLKQIDTTHSDKQLSLDLQQRALNLRSQDNTANRFLRFSQFQARYGSGADAAQKDFDQIAARRAAIQKQMVQLSMPGQDKNGKPTLSPRDEGRIDAEGHPVPNATPTEAYTSFISLKAQDANLNEMQYHILHGRPSAPSLAPMPVTNGNGQPMPGVSVPTVPTLPGFGAALGAFRRMLPGTQPAAPRPPRSASPNATAARSRLLGILNR